MSRCVWIGNLMTDADWDFVHSTALSCGRVARVEALSNRRWARLTMSKPHAAVLLIQAIGDKTVTRDGRPKPCAKWALVQPVPRYLLKQRRLQRDDPMTILKKKKPEEDDMSLDSTL